MGIQNWAENVILVDLASEPQMSEELQSVVEIVRDRGDCDVVVDFANAELVTSSCLANLLRLHKMLKSCDHKLVLCGLNNRTKSIFVVAGLDGIFEFVDEQFVALASLQLAN